jgi:hypothetical protein
VIQFHCFGSSFTLLAKTPKSHDCQFELSPSIFFVSSGLRLDEPHSVTCQSIAKRLVNIAWHNQNDHHKIKMADRSGDLDERREFQETRCGILCCRPNWMQRFANKRAFLFCFCTTSVLQGMYFTYIVSVLSTLERLYQMPSRTMGLVLATSELGQIVGSLALAHFGGRGDRPKWIGAGVLVFAIASLLCSTPHFLLPTPQLSSASSSSSLSVFGSNESSFLATRQLCHRNASHNGQHVSRQLICNDSDTGNSDAKHAAFVATCVLTTASLLIGFGTTAVNTLGIPYIDDNVTSKESPLYFGMQITRGASHSDLLIN